MFEKNLDKLCKKLEKNKALTNLNAYDYFNFFIRLNNSPLRNYYIISEFKDKYDTRCLISNTLKAINYKRDGEKWTPEVVAAFIHEVIELQGNGTIEQLKEISTRYNVELHRINNLVSFFLGIQKDTYNLDFYFTDYDYYCWKYRNEKSLNKAIENKTMNGRELKIMHDLKEAQEKDMEELMKKIMINNLGYEP